MSVSRTKDTAAANATVSCYNNHRHEEEREEVIQQMLSRDPHVFDSHVDKKVEMGDRGDV